MLGDADRVVLAGAEDTVTVGILPPATTRDERDGDPTTSGCSSWLSPSKVDRPVMHGLVGVRNITPSGWEGRECVLRMDAFRGHPCYGVKVVHCGCPHHGKTGGQKLLHVR